MYDLTYTWNLKNKQKQIQKEKSDLWLPEVEGGVRGGDEEK